MPKFALISNQFAEGHIKFFNLEIDGIDQFDTFEDSIEEKHESELRQCASYISLLSEGKHLPPRKKRKLGGISKAGELKTKHLRVYYIVIPEYGYTICILGYKKNQDKDIARLKTLRTSILTQIEENEGIEIKE